MSRSYKRVPCCAFRTKGMKKCANQRVRHYANLSNGSFYKKVFQSYDICDYKSIYYYHAFIHDYLSDLKTRAQRKYLILHNLNYYYKRYVRK